MIITKKFESSAVNTFKIGDPKNFIYGKDEYLYTDNKNKYLDLVSGSAVTILGHNNKEHIKITKQVLKSGIFHTGTRLTNKYREDLYLILDKVLPKNINTFHLVNSGSEAVETALKVVQYVTKKSGAISFTGGYHGRTIGALSVTHDKKLRTSFQTLKNNVFLPYPGTYKNNKEKYSEEECLNKINNYFKKKKNLPPVAIIECIQAVSGIIIPSKKFIKAVFKILKKNNIYIIADEIWNGMGRTGRLFSFEKYDVKPDIVCLGKSLSATIPLSAVAAPKKLLKNWPPGIHTSTFQGNPIACALSKSTFDQILSKKLLVRVNKIEQIFKQFSSRIINCKYVGDVRVVGAQAGIEFLDKKNLPNKHIVNILVKTLLIKKIIVYAGGEKSNVLMLIPPIIIKYNNLKKALKIIEKEIISLN